MLRRASCVHAEGVARQVYLPDRMMHEHLISEYLTKTCAQLEALQWHQLRVRFSNYVFAHLQAHQGQEEREEAHMAK
jgi:hypothetical protein